MVDVKITNFEGVYEPAEDSYLFVNRIPEIKGSVLEIGCGTGIIGISLAIRGCEVTAIDLNPNAVEATRFNSKINNVQLEILEGNMFSPIKNRTFDSIVCNPPYLPPLDEPYNDPRLALAVEGGPTGSEFTLELLKHAVNYLNPNGSVYLLLSSKMKKLDLDWNKEILYEEKHFFEELRLVRFWRS